MDVQTAGAIEELIQLGLDTNFFEGAALALGMPGAVVVALRLIKHMRDR